jgi:hypothetical protein
VLVVTGAAIVVSSSWRLDGIGPGSEIQVRLRRICREMDGHTQRFDRIAARIVGATERLRGGYRQREVESYVARHCPDRFAAVDDWLLDFSSPPPDWLVVTDPDRGLDERAVAHLIALLGEAPGVRASALPSGEDGADDTSCVGGSERLRE